MKRFLGMSAEEIAENERLWREENDENLNTPPTDASAEMRGAGIVPAGISADIEGAEEIAPDGTTLQKQDRSNIQIQSQVETQPRVPRGNNRPKRYKY